MTDATTTGLAAVNGQQIYYEVHGEGEPLILLHGGITATDGFGDTLPALARHRKVFALHLQGHGRTPNIDWPLRYETLGDDVAAVIEHLGIGPADVMGYSFGGGAALQLAIRHPEAVRRLIVVSMEFRRDGSYPEVLAALDGMRANAAMIGAGMARSPYAAMYPEVNWETSFRKMGDLLEQPLDWSEGIAAIDVPTLLVFADADSIRPEHMVEFWRLLGGGERDAGMDGSARPGSRLAIVPGTTHYSIPTSRLVPILVESFLSEVAPRS